MYKPKVLCVQNMTVASHGPVRPLARDGKTVLINNLTFLGGQELVYPVEYTFTMNKDLGLRTLHGNTMKRESYMIREECCNVSPPFCFSFIPFLSVIFFEKNSPPSMAESYRRSSSKTTVAKIIIIIILYVHMHAKSGSCRCTVSLFSVYFVIHI